MTIPIRCVVIVAFLPYLPAGIALYFRITRPGARDNDNPWAQNDRPVELRIPGVPGCNCRVRVVNQAYHDRGRSSERSLRRRVTVHSRAR
jgi:hypothetical protein